MARQLASNDDPDYGFALHRLRAAKTDLVYQGRPTSHRCNPTLCNPQSEQDLCPNPISSNLFLCKYGTIHLCTEDLCEFHVKSELPSCPVSGIHYGVQSWSSYDKNDPRTWRAKDMVVEPPMQDRKRLKVSEATNLALVPRAKPSLSKEYVQRQTEEILITLLFSPARERFNRVFQEERAEHMRKACQTYTKECQRKHEVVLYTELLRITRHFASEPPPLTIFTTHRGSINYYCGIVWQIWERTLKHFVPRAQKQFDAAEKEIVPRIDLQQVILGTLYSMRQGFFVNGFELLPRDRFLELHLPAHSDVESFGFARNEVTQGTTLLQQVYANAIADGHLLPQLGLDMNAIPKKDAPSHLIELGKEKSAP